MSRRLSPLAIAKMAEGHFSGLWSNLTSWLPRHPTGYPETKPPGFMRGAHKTKGRQKQSWRPFILQQTPEPLDFLHTSYIRE